MDVDLEKSLTKIKSILLAGLTEEEREAVKDNITIYEYKKNTILLREKGYLDNIYLILRGEIEIIKKGIFDKLFYRAKKAQFIGEMSFFHRSGKFVTAKCLTNLKIACLTFNRTTSRLIRKSITRKIKSNISRLLVDKIRLLEHKSNLVLEEKLLEFKKRVYFGRVFIIIMTSFCFSTFINRIIYDKYYNIDIYSPIFTWLYLILLIAPAYCFIILTRQNLASFGLTLVGLKESFYMAVIYSLPVAICILLVQIFYSQYSANGSIAFPRLSENLNLVAVISYILHSYLQESLARGFVQNSLLDFYGNKKTALCIASICFAIFHVHYGIQAVIITFIAGIYFGIIKLKNDNIICVSIVHFILGIEAFALGLI